MASDTVVFSFGRFNPPTLGHKIIRDTVIDIAESCNFDHIIGVSCTSGNSHNPLKPETKFSYLPKILGYANYELSTPDKMHIVDWLTYINISYKNVVLVCGSDRSKEYFRMLENCNTKNFNFSTTTVLPCVRNDENWLSGTKIRSFVNDGDYKSFRSAYKDVSPIDIFNLYRDINSINRPKRESSNRSNNAKEVKKAKEKSVRRNYSIPRG